MDIENLNIAISNGFSTYEKIGDGIIRATKTWCDHTYQIHYIDFSQNILKEDLNFEEYQKKLLLEDYYSIDGAIQWSFYLHILIDENNINNKNLKKVKYLIESNKILARKIIQTESEFLKSFKEQENIQSEGVPDLINIWSDSLPDSLQEIFNEKSAMNNIVESYIENKEHKKRERKIRPNMVEQFPYVNKLTINEYRQYPLKRKYEFGLVNLISGPNATGKTSLLEIFELMACGKTLRNPLGNNNFEFSVTSENNENMIVKKEADGFYRSRDFHWYGKTYPQKNYLEKSFSRFNYFDADAAVMFSDRLKKDEKKVDFNKSLSQVIFGPDTNIIFDRIQKIKEQSDDKIKLYSQQLTTDKNYLKEYESEIQSIKNSSVEHKSKDVIKDKLVGWGVRLFDFSNEALENMLDNIARTTISLKSWDSAKKYGVNNFSDFDSKISIYNKYSSDLKVYEEKIKTLKIKLRAITLNEKHNKTIISSLKRVQDYIKSEAIELVGIQAKIDKVNELIITSEKAIKLFDSIDLKLIAEFGLMTVDESRKYILKSIKDIASVEDIHSKSLGSIRTKLDKTKLISSEIKSLALQYVKFLPDSDTCPLCFTQFNNQKLSERLLMQERVVDNAQSEIEELFTLVSNANAEKNNLENKLKVIDVLGVVSQTLESKSSINILLSHLDEKKNALNENKEKYRKLIDKKSFYIESNYSPEEIDSLLENHMISNSDNNLASAVVNEIDQITSENENIKKNKLLISNELNTIETVVRDIISVNFGNVKVETSDDVFSILSILINYKNEVGYIDNLITLDKKSTLKSTEELLGNINELIFKYLNIYKSSKKETELKVKSQELKRAIKNNLTRLKRGKDLSEKLNFLINEKNPDVLRSKFIDKYKNTITNIFRKLHSPVEFSKVDIVDDAIVLIRNNHDSHVPLTELSTGQRSALVLSIFLTMNKALVNGPKILIFDDPVAYVDDLNVLSFIDYLQEFALNEEKQIFFATANDKISSLFSKKFEFLKNKEKGFKHIKLSRLEYDNIETMFL